MSCAKLPEDAKTLIASKNIYPCRNWFCDKFHKSEDKEVLFDAIYFLQPARVKEILQDFDEKLAKESKCQDDTMLDYIFLHLMYYRDESHEYPTLARINFFSISHPDYNNNSSVEKICEIIEIICAKFPVLIKEEHLETVVGQRIQKLITILTKYSKDKPNADECFVCSSTYSTHLIPNTCSCKNKVHLECLIKLVKQFGNICTVCKTTNNAVIDPRNRVIFPKNNIYKEPLLSNYIIINQSDLSKSLSFAVAYLQVERVKELLGTMSSDDMKKYIEFNTNHYGVVHKNAKLELVDVPYTNLYRSMFQDTFIEIEKLLKSKLES